MRFLYHKRCAPGCLGREFARAPGVPMPADGPIEVMIEHSNFFPSLGRQIKVYDDDVDGVFRQMVLDAKMVSNSDRSRECDGPWTAWMRLVDDPYAKR